MSGFRWSADPIKEFAQHCEIWLEARDGERRWVYPVSFVSRSDADTALPVIEATLGAVNNCLSELEQEAFA